MLRGGQIAHLKMTMMPDDHDGAVAVLNMVRNDYVAELAQSLAEKMRRGTLLVNLRAEADPRKLEEIVRQAIANIAERSATMAVAIEHLAQFRPAAPKPTWRMTDAQNLLAFEPI